MEIVFALSAFVFACLMVASQRQARSAHQRVDAAFELVTKARASADEWERIAKTWEDIARKNLETAQRAQDAADGFQRIATATTAINPLH